MEECFPDKCLFLEERGPCVSPGKHKTISSLMTVQLTYYVTDEAYSILSAYFLLLCIKGITILPTS